MLRRFRTLPLLEGCKVFYEDYQGCKGCDIFYQGLECYERYDGCEPFYVAGYGGSLQAIHLLSIIIIIIQYLHFNPFPSS